MEFLLFSFFSTGLGVPVGLIITGVLIVKSTTHGKIGFVDKILLNDDPTEPLPFLLGCYVILAGVLCLLGMLLN